MFLNPGPGAVVETLSDYLRRKHAEIALLEATLDAPSSAAEQVTIADIAARKFQAAAQLKSKQAKDGWRFTETHWTRQSDLRSGPFRLEYNYQRADLTVFGPPIYPLPAGLAEWSCDYTSSGMAALAAIMLAISQVIPGASIAIEPDGYPETAELLQTYGAPLGLRPVTPDQGHMHVRLRDSGSPRYPGPSDPTGLDLLVFDTTCLTASSGRIGAVLRTATRAGTAVALVRSHTKLNSLGVEYGRLGSVVLAAPAVAKPLAERLVPALRTAIRLIGAAAVPEHLPPFVASKSWRALTRARVSRIIRNNHRAARALGARCYHHGLFFTLDFGANWTEDQARNAARNLAASLSDAGFPARQAGSFGFDFTVMDAFPAPGGEPWLVRIALPDLPDQSLDSMIDTIRQACTRLHAAAHCAELAAGRRA